MKHSFLFALCTQGFQNMLKATKSSINVRILAKVMRIRKQHLTYTHKSHKFHVLIEKHPLDRMVLLNIFHNALELLFKSHFESLKIMRYALL